MAENPQPLSVLISAAAVLSGNEKKTVDSRNIATVLKSRLVRAYAILAETDSFVSEEGGLDKLQYTTAKESLRLVERLQNLLDPLDSSVSESALPLLGTRDLSYIRILLSLVFKWAIQPLIAELELTRPGATVLGRSQIIDLTERRLDFEDLPPTILRLLALVFNAETSRKVRQTWITTTILNHHAADLLVPCLIIGWSPQPISDVFARSTNDTKLLSIRFTNLLSTPSAIATLGAILSSRTAKPTPFHYISKTCSHLLSDQLKRLDGVQGLCIAVLGEDTDEAEVVPLDKLEHIAKVLRTVPASLKPEPYYRSMIPRILDLLLPHYSQGPSSHRRAAAFTLSRMLSPRFQHHGIASAILLPLLHKPFLEVEDSKAGTEIIPSPSSHAIVHLAPTDALKTLQAILLHTDPSPVELSVLLTPIVPELYTLASLHRSSLTTDPNVRESLNGLLSTWGRIVSSSDAIQGLWSIISGLGGDWELGFDGFTRCDGPTSGPSISLLEATALASGSKKDVDIHANPFHLRPDPPELVAFLKSLDRKDVSSDIFLKLLDGYRSLKESEADPIRTLFYLQLILQVQSQLSESILSKKEHVLSFIKHALGSAPLPHPPPKTPQKRGLGLEDLRIIESEGPDGDSDDEDDDQTTEGLSNSGDGKDEMAVTAITLLLSVLEANPDVSPHNAPALNDVLTSLEHLALHGTPAVQQLAREARLVLTARKASTSSTPSASAPRSQAESAQAAYQKALKHLQDPIIPVRVHGLHILRELVSRASPSTSKASQTGADKPQLDPALVPGILSIFLQSIQDDESYVFLNAVQGLAAMVDGYGRDVLRGVMDVYLSGTGVGGSGASSGVPTMTRAELDARVRVGEALSVVVKRCGDALGFYADALVPPLLTILRSSHLPTTLRTSAFSILAQCAGTNVVALSAYTTGLVDTCVELVQLESVAAKNQSQKPKEPASEDLGAGGAAQPELADTEPTTSNVKAPALRRAALHLLSQLLRSHIAGLYDVRASSASAPPVTLHIDGVRIPQDTTITESVLERAGIVLRYVAATDEDGVTRVMAGEASELAVQYREARLGF